MDFANDLTTQLSLFALGFSSLFPLVNPIGTALILNHYFAKVSDAERRTYAFTISLYSFVLGLLALLLGSWVLKFMGISVATTQLGGGIMIAIMGFRMLNQEAVQNSEVAPADTIKNSLFYPMTFPLTLGPGGISTLITLSAHAHAPNPADTLIQMAVLSGSLLIVMVITYFCFRYSNAIIQKVGPNGSLVLNRLMAFLVFCIGLQVALHGLMQFFPQLKGS